MECNIKDKLEQHLSDIRKLAARLDLTWEERKAAVRAEEFALALLKDHIASGHNGKRCPFGSHI